MMAPVNCIQFSYLGTTRYVICDLDTRYEQMQRLVATTFRLPEECITAIQFSDGKGYLFNKDIFEYFLILFPQPEQKFYVRLECSRIIENRIAYKEGKCTPFRMKKDTNKRTHRDMQETELIMQAAPVRRQNCFLGTFPDSGHILTETDDLSQNSYQNRKRMRLMKSNKRAIKKCIKPPQPKRVLRI